MSIFLKKLLGQYIYWYCDNCGFLMNDQKGFDDKKSVWECQNCGFKNDVSKNNLNGNKVKEEYNEEVKEYYTSISKEVYLYNDVVTEDVFNQMAIDATKNIKRIEGIKVSDGILTGTVRTISGIDTWTFNIDFNCYGVINGTYKILEVENEDSIIPDEVANRIKKMILDIYNKHGVELPIPSIFKVDNNYFCERCGSSINDQQGFNNDCMFWKCKCCGTMNKLPLHLVKDTTDN